MYEANKTLLMSMGERDARRRKQFFCQQRASCGSKRKIRINVINTGTSNEPRHQEHAQGEDAAGVAGGARVSSQ